MPNHKRDVSQDNLLIHLGQNRYRRTYRRKNGEPANRYFVEVECAVCKKKHLRSTRNAKKGGRGICSKDCKRIMLSKPDGNKKFKRGHPGSPVLIKQSNHPAADRCGYVHEHRLIMERKLGRLLHTREVVHHINMMKDDNRIENLDLIESNSKHFLAHGSLNTCVSTLIKEGYLEYDRKTQRYYCNV